MSLGKEVRHACRMLARNPVFTLVAILSLALGTGANSAIYSIVDAVLLRPLPYQDPDRLVALWQTDTANPAKNLPFPAADFFDFQAQSRSFERIEGYHPWSFNLTGDGTPEQLPGGVVTAGLFPLLGRKPVLGRNFLPEEDSPGGPPAVLLSHGLWHRRFGADPKVLGKKLDLDGKLYTVVGVMPPGMEFPPLKAQIWLPLGEDRKSTDRELQYLRVIGRLKPSTSLAAALTDVSATAARLEREYGETNKGRGARAVPLRDQLVGKIRPALLVLLGAVFLLLGVACVNVANLTLVRASARREELAVRSALGAARGRLVRQLLIESLLLSFAGAALGLLFAHWGIRFLVSLSPQRAYGLDEAAIDARVLAFTLVIAVLAALAFGLVPALRASRPNLNQILKSASGRLQGGARLARLLAAAEVALTFTLLIGAGLLVQSFLHLRSVSPGFNPKNVLTMQVSLPEEAYPGLPQTSGFLNEVVRRVRALPGVQSVGATSTLPLSNGMNIDDHFTIEGDPPVAPGDRRTAYIRPVSPDYLRAMEIPLIAGRSLTERDHAGAPAVAVVNETMAREFKDGRVLGRRLVLEEMDLGSPGKFEAVPRQVVGIVADVKHVGLDSETPSEVYLPVLQGTWRIYSLVIRTSQDPTTLAKSVSREIWAVDKSLPISDVQTLEKILDESVAQSRFSMLLLSAFAVVALLLATIGIYGVVSYSVALRIREVGLRMALGAHPRDVLRLIVGGALVLVLGGIAVGLCASMALTRLMASLMFGVETNDPKTFVAVTIVLGIVALLASYLPALRASRLDPMAILRTD
jgi:putative ABC transport system permease protein